MNRFIPGIPTAAALLAAAAVATGQTPAPNAVARDGYVDAGDGARLYYRLVGSGPDTLVVIHGGPGLTMDYFLDDLAPLAEGRTLLFYDQRGTGRSTLVTDSAALTGARFADDLEAIRRHFGFERIALLGHSWGAGVVALYAERYADRIDRLVMVGSIPPVRRELLAAFEKLDAARDSVTRRRMREAREARLADPGNADKCRAYYVLWFEPFFADAAAAQRSKGDFCAGTPASRRNKIASVDRYTAASLGEWDWRETMRRVRAPTLFVHGTRDVLPIASGRAWAALMPNARFVQLDSVGHFPYLEVPDRFFRTVDGFLRLERSVAELRHAIGRWNAVTRFLDPDGSVARTVAGTYEFSWVVPDRVVTGRSDIPELDRSAGLLFYINEATGVIEMVSVGRDGRLWVMTGPLGGSQRSTGLYEMPDGSTQMLRFTRFNVARDSFESRMEYSTDAGRTWKPGNHQSFRRVADG